MGGLHAAPGSGSPANRTGVAGSGGGAGHTPVMLERCLELLGPALTASEEPVHIDATLGLGGHAEAVLVAHPRARLIGLDRDPTALERSRQRLRPYTDRVRLEHAVFDELAEVLRANSLSTVDSILFDLGVSSIQLDETERGFAYSRDAPLDMRMDPTRGITAEEVVNTYPVEELARVLRVYGEERFAGRIAAAIVAERARRRLTSSARLADLVRDSIPAAARRTGGNPAKRTFQALRIEVNGELTALESALGQALDSLRVGGRVVVLAYHSLEDRMVKRALAERARSNVPVDLPFVPAGSGPTLRLLTRGAEQATDAEVAINPRAASVRLRAAEHVDPDAPAQAQPMMRQPRTRGHQGDRRRRGRRNTEGEQQ